MVAGRLGSYAWRLHDSVARRPRRRPRGAGPRSACRRSRRAAAPRGSGCRRPRRRDKDLPWRIDAIGTVQPIATVALRTHFDATVDQGARSPTAPRSRPATCCSSSTTGRPRRSSKGAQAQLAKDEAQLEQAKRDVTRYTDLVARSATPVINLDNAKTAVA